MSAAETALAEALESRFGGLFRSAAAIPLRPHDPDLAVHAGLALAGPGGETAVGGAGLTPAEARAAAIGEAVERSAAHRLPQDDVVRAPFRDLPPAARAIEPGRFVLFSAEQHAQAGFPFEPLRDDTPCDWIACRDAGTGARALVPAALVFLDAGPGERHAFAPGLSTGLACGARAHPVVLRGLEEVIERDALMGAWWGRYPLEAWSERTVLERLLPDLAARVRRPNRRLRFYRARTPFSDHVTIATIEGEDREGFVFAAGAACREDRRASFAKSLTEAVQGFHHVRRLKALARDEGPEPRPPRSFEAHAVYYSVFPDALARTPFATAEPAASEADDGAPSEDLAALRARLGPGRPVLFRILTPPGLAAALDVVVVRVVVPGLQPMHGDHALPFLGGPLWTRPLAAWADVPPHPFP